MTRADRLARLTVALAVVAAVAVRLVALRGADEVVVTDEVGYVGNARWLAGGYPDMTLPGTVYSPGYALLLAPLARVLRDPGDLHAAGVVLNVLLVATVLPLAYALLRRLLDAPPLAAAAGAVAAGAYPALTVQPATLWAESLLVPLVLVWLLALTLSVRGAAGALTVHAVAGVALYATHSRMVGALPTTLLALVLVRRRRLLGRRAVVVAGAAFLAALAATRLLVAAIGDDLYVFGGVSEGRFLDDVLATPLRLWVASTSGQLWYLVAATLGTVVAGVAALLGTLRSRDRRVVGVAALVGLALFAAVSVAQMASGLAALPAEAPRVRADFLVYGRYNEAWAVPLVAVGTGWLLTRDLPRVAAVGAAAAGLLALGAAGLLAGFPADWRAAGVNSANVLGLVGLLQDAGGLDVGAVTRAVLLPLAAVAAAVLVAARWRPAGVAVPVVLVAAFTGQAHAGVTGWLATSVAYQAPRHVVADTVAREGWTGVVQVQDDATGPPLYLLQYWAPRVRAAVSVDDPRVPGDQRPPRDPSARWFLTVGGPPPPGAGLVEVEPRGTSALWALPGPEQERLRAAGRLAPLGALPPAAARSAVRVQGGRAPYAVVTHLGTGAAWRAAGGGLEGTTAVRLTVTWSGCASPVASVSRPADLPRVVAPGETVRVPLVPPTDLRGCTGVTVVLGQRGGPVFGGDDTAGAPVVLP